jgi:hypothetical protein
VEIFNAGTTNLNLTGWTLKGDLSFIFPTNLVIAPGAYLVVAADGPTFAATHPGVTNVLAPWTGRLKDHVSIHDSAGQTENAVEFHKEGDWATRVLGPTQYNHQGWEWFAPHDGLGKSLELINAALPNTFAHNWNSSTPQGGTPGRVNSVARNDAAPFVSEVSHNPIIPKSTDAVTIAARVVDEIPAGLTVTLKSRVDGSPGFDAQAMLDDGAHGDGVAGDGIFGAILPQRPDTTIVEFFIEARDAANNIRIYPAFDSSGNPARTANLLYQVDNQVYAGGQPIYRIIMRESERAELAALGRVCPDSDSDASMNATWITRDAVVTDGTTTQLRYNVGVRNRGHGTRQANPNNYHVDIPEDRLWKKLAGINLNSQYAHSQVLGSAIFNRTEVPMPDSRAVQVRINSTNLMAVVSGNSFGSYAANEQYNNDFIKRVFPNDSEGNAYRGVRDQALCDPTTSGLPDLTWHGANYAQAVYTNAYFKQNNLTRNDWSDLIDLLAVLNSTNGHAAANYVADVRQRINVDQWMKYMAVNTLIDNEETALANGAGDDYGLYRGTNDTRFLALPYDLDTVLGRGLTSTSPRNGIFRMNALPVMRRFMTTPEFAPLYYKWLKQLAETTFAPANMDPMIDQTLAGFVSPQALQTMKAFNVSHVAYVLSQVPSTLTVSNGLAVSSGYPRTTTGTIELSGFADAIKTLSVLVNGSPANYTAWQGRWTNSFVTLHPGLNRLLIQALGTNGVEVERTNVTIWFDDSSVQNVGGTVAANTTWTAANGPYSITSTLTVASGVTLTIEPGTSVYLASGVNLVVANGGRILAEGTESAGIHFSSAPGSGTSWGAITINGAGASPETRLSHVYFQDNSGTCIEVAGGTISLDHAVFGTTTHQYLSVDGASFLVSHCYFPAGTTVFELMHGTGGIKAGGRGIVRHCYFGATLGYSDVIDFTGGNRPGQPIAQFYNNVFAGSSDDVLDLDGTDAWVEGNIFMHVHQNGSPDSASAVSGGDNGGDTSQVTIVGNLFYDCDDAATAKQGNFFTMINNTVVRITNEGGTDSNAGVINVRDFPLGGAPTTFGAGYYMEGNIVVDVPQLVRNYDPAQTSVFWTNNIIPIAWTGPGGGNRVVAPLLNHIPAKSETVFTTWEAAQILRDWFSLRPGSPGIGSGPNGLDAGGVIPLGASISGEPDGTSNQTTATLHVGVNRTGNGIPAAGWPQGSGYVAFKWRLDGGAWSAETPIATPISLSNLSNGPHRVDVSGKRDSGIYQDDAELGGEAVISSSRVWTVDTNHVPPTKSTVRINEILAKNVTIFTNGITTPDLIELFNEGTAPVNLGGVGLSDDATQPYRFIFDPGTMLGAGEYLILFADSETGGDYRHTGFGLKDKGGALYLSAPTADGGALIDSIEFGLQIANHSIGRLNGGVWGLCQPTFGAENRPEATGELRGLKINEWLADAQFVANNDFIELYNTNTLPVALGGLYLSDSSGAPDRHRIAPLSFIDAQGFSVFIADGDTHQGAEHLDFKLSPEVGLILLSAPDLSLIDVVNYGPQQTDVSQGRSPNGGDVIVSFTQPTPGGSNPGTTSGGCVLASETIPLLPMNVFWRYNQTANLDGINWQVPDYNDAGWPQGRGLLAVEDCNCLPPPGIGTTLSIGRNTYYFRTRFTVSTNLDGFNLNVTMVVDDGAVVSLNGTRILTNGIATGTPLYTTPASRNVGNAGLEFFTLPTSLLQMGTNVLAVEVHQVGNGSSDVTWGMAIDTTRTYTNCIAGEEPPSVVLNEVLALNNAITNLNSLTADYVELFNHGTNAVDLSGMSLSDDSAFPRKWVFANGSSLAAGAYRVIYFTDELVASSTNTGFHLKSTGTTVFFFDKPSKGGGLLDAVSFGLQIPNYPIARIPNGTGGWSLAVPTPGALNAAAGLGSVSALRVNEWMADPSKGNDWFEIFNTGNEPVALGGLFLTDNLADKTQSPIPPLSFIGTGSDAFIQFIADGQVSQGADHVNFNLKKAGEALGIYSPSLVLLDGVSFGKQTTGISEGRFPDGNAAVVAFPGTASPAESNFLPLPNAVINELLAHSDPPFEDAIELYNPTALNVEIGGWFLSNSKQDYRKFRIPNGTTLPAGGFKVFYENEFNSTNGVPFTFNSAHGDRAILSQADALGNLSGYRAEVEFGATENGVSLGRYQTSVGVDFTALKSKTFGVNNPASVEQFRAGTGAVNSEPKVGPLVITEILFFSATNSIEISDDEFVELRNVGDSDLPLFDPVAPTNTWTLRNAVSFDFPTNVVVPRGDHVLVVSFDPSDLARKNSFRARFGVPPTVPIFGPWLGRLANEGDTIELYKPDPAQLPPHPDAGFVPRVLVEKISYSAFAPWPSAITPGSESLQRLVAGDYGNDPVNWKSAPPTAGRDDSTNDGDSDHDGLLDTWELSHFGTLERDGTGDFDGDRMSDRDEFIAGTDPKNAADALKFTSVVRTETQTVLEFHVVAGKTYTVLYKERLTDPQWQKLENIPAQASDGTYPVTDPAPSTATRYYRLVTPSIP